MVGDEISHVVKRPYTAPSLERMSIEKTANSTATNGDAAVFVNNTAFPPPGAS